MLSKMRTRFDSDDEPQLPDPFDALVDRSPFGIIVVDADFRIRRVSAAALPAFRNIRPLVGRDVGEALRVAWPEPFASEAATIFRHTLMTGEAYVSPGLTERRNDLGSVESYEWQTSRLMLPDGRFGVVCYFLDTTRLQQAHAAVRESEERFRTFLTATSNVVYRMSPDWTEMRHLEGKEFIADTLQPSQTWLATYIPADEQAAVKAAIDRAIRSKGLFELEHRVIRTDGTIGWTHSRAMPILDAAGELVEWFGAASDVTRRKEAEAALSHSEERYRTLFDSMDEGFCIIDMLYDASGRPRDYRFVEVNPAFAKHTGLQDAVGRTVLELIPNHEPHWFRIYGEVAETGTPVRFENRGAGMQRWFDVYAFRLGGPGSRRVAVLFSDITQRTLAEAAVDRARKYAEATLRTSPVPLLVLEGDLRVVSANDAFYDHFRVTADQTEGRPLDELGNRQWHIPDLLARLSQIVPEQTSFDDFEVTHEFAGIGRRTMLLNARRMEVEEGGPERIVLVIDDVTERKTAETTLRASEARHAFLLTLADALRPLAHPLEIEATAARLVGEHLGVDRAYYVEVNETTGVARVNTSYQRGDSPSLVGQHRIADFAWVIPPMRRGDVLVIPNAAECPLIPVADRPAMAALAIAAQVNAPLVKDGTLVGAFCVTMASPRRWSAEDVELVRETSERIWAAVERAKAERALAESERRFRLMADAVPQLMWVADATGHIEFVNKQWRDYAGATAEPASVDGMTAQFAHPDDAQVARAAFADAMRTGAGFEVEQRHRSKSGDYRWFLNRAEPYRDPHTGELVKWVGIAIDIDDRKRAEDTLREADRRKDEFLAMLAHELRNPLAPVRTGLELIRLAGNNAASVERVRATMARQVGHMVRLIDDLLDVSRITSGKIQLQRTATLLADLVSSAVDANRAALDAARVRLTVDIPETPCTLDADPTRMAQVLSNLLHNAAKFTPAGGQVTLSARCHPTADDGSGGELEIRVSDDGVGISAEMLPRVFELFSQDAQTEERPQPGLGVGLALAKRLVEMHGGRIEAASEGRHRGSVFTVRLPVVQGRVAHEGPSAAAGGATVTRRVVVVDDNEDAAYLTALLIEELGGETTVAHDGHAGLRAVHEFRPDVVLLDIGLPGMDGYETCRAIRQSPGGNEVFIVAVTGWGQDRDKRRAIDAGFDAHLTKPVDPTVLERILAEPRDDASR